MFLTQSPVRAGASPSGYTRRPRAVWPGGASCLCLVGTVEEDGGVCCSVARRMKPSYSDTSPLCCHWPQVCLFITPAAWRAAWARGVIDLFTRRFPRGCRVVARTFIFRCGRWQPGCVRVSARGTESQPSLCLGLAAIPLTDVGRDAGPSPQDSLPAHVFLYFIFFFFLLKRLRDGDGEINFLCNPNQWKVKSISPHQFCFHCWFNLSSPPGRALHSHSVPSLGVVWLLAQWCMTHLFS